MKTFLIDTWKAFTAPAPIPFIVVLLYASLTGIGIATIFTGCPSHPTPPTSHDCFDDSDIRQSCSTCASTPVCVWCASPDGQRRGCYPRDQAVDCDGEMVRISDDCSNLEDGLHRPAEQP